MKNFATNAFVIVRGESFQFEENDGSLLESRWIGATDGLTAARYASFQP